MIEADVVIVGGGTAGAVLANRLSDDPSVQVLLIEAGGEARSPLVQVPVGFARLVANRAVDWCYEQEPDPSIHGRRFLWSAGRLLGGSSSINGQVYIRGLRADFDRWVAHGATGWSFDDVLPYFQRSENWTGTPHPAHGRGGPLTVSPMRDFHPLCHPFLDACAQVGIPTLPDYHGGDMTGAFLTDGTQRDGWRCSTEKAFLRPARSRPNLQVMTNCRVTALVLDQARATGVRVQRGTTMLNVAARREVVVSAGAIGSAALLLRSGIGSEERLRAAGITVHHALRGVGANLQEHVSVGQNKFVNQPTLNAQTDPLSMLRHAWHFANGRKGVLAAPAVQAMALTRTRPDVPQPDIQLHFLPLAYDITPDTVSTASAAMPREATVTINTTLCQPHARGHVALGANGEPRIVHRFLEDERDVATLVGAQRLVDRIFRTPAFRSLVIGDRAPPSSSSLDDAGWADYARWKASPAYHPVGTCRMGVDGDAVVDPCLRVHGLGGLRVVDASVMPTITSGNTNAPTIMIAEKAADLIRDDLRRSH